MSCLGERLTALVDDELGHEERDRVLAHLAGCAQCRAEVAGLRRLKGRLRGLSGLPAADGVDDLPTPDFLTRLRSLPAAAEPPPAADVPPPHRPARPPRSSTRPARPSAGRVDGRSGRAGRCGGGNAPYTQIHATEQKHTLIRR
ncbi:anti-sigma factor, partial [Actinomadura sp. BRA 177]|uniref:anti-sigma factor family protein n=1 Tax=Actinomadura sp. BRA 177 TaxID=2745202 RepID=UPI0015959243